MRWTDEQLAEYQAKRNKPAQPEPTSRRGAAESLDSGVGQVIRQSRRESQPIRQAKKKQPNKTERRFEIEFLEPWKHEKSIADYYFEEIKLKLANGVLYIPDYAVIEEIGALTIYEVKGGFIREDAKIKLKVAASQFKHFKFYLAQYDKGEWAITRVWP
jgi:hypothetical protein